MMRRKLLHRVEVGGANIMMTEVSGAQSYNAAATSSMMKMHGVKKEFK